MKWKVKTYTTINGKDPIKDFISTLQAKEEARVLSKFDKLEEFGIFLKYPEASNITGYKRLKELRIKCADSIVRIFYFLHTNRTFILLHGFKKKTNKIPKKEIEIAKRRMEDYISRNSK